MEIKNIKNKLLTFLLLFITSVFVLDFTLASGGKNSFLLHLHPLLSHIGLVVILFTTVFIFFMALDLSSKRKFKHLILLVLYVVIMFSGYKLISSELAKSSKKIAYQRMLSIINDKEENVDFEIEKDANEVFKDFKAHRELFTIRPYISSPAYSRYFFVAFKNGTSILMFQLDINRDKTRVWAFVPNKTIYENQLPPELRKP